jgi:hypothetical protein
MTGASIPQTKPFLIAWCICLIAMELLGGKILGGQSTIDFEFVYVAGYQVRTHPSQLYDLTQQDRLQRALTGRPGTLAFYHPSYEALLFAPLSLLKFRPAYFASIAVNMLLLMAAFFAALPTFSSVIPLWQPRPGLMFFTFIPAFVALILGQDSILSLLFYCLAWRQLESGKDMSAGCFLALAIFKFQIVIPVAALIGIHRGWRFARGFLLTSTTLVLLSFGIVGINGLKDYIRLLLGVAYIHNGLLAQRIAVAPLPLSMPNLTGLIYGSGGRQLIHSAVTFDALVGACSLAMFVWCAHAIRHCDDKAGFSIAVLCGLLLSYHLLIYELTLLLLPIALMSNRIHRYILISLFVFPFVTVSIGARWIFLIAAPMLAMLVNVIRFSAHPVIPEPETARA